MSRRTVLLLVTTTIGIGGLISFQNCSSGFRSVSGSTVESSSNAPAPVTPGGSSPGITPAPGTPTTLPSTGTTPPSYIGKNTFPITIDAKCGGLNGYNSPCVSVTVCPPDSKQCVTVNNILFDTGSVGLRIYKSVLAGLQFPQRKSAAGGDLTECYRYGDGTYGFWGPVQLADVKLGDEIAKGVAIHVVDPNYGNRASSPNLCSVGWFDTPANSGVNGILGTRQDIEDCGDNCTLNSTSGMYFSCGSSGCQGSTVSLEEQVKNPVALMPFDNNGYIVQFPSVPALGAPLVTGQVILGIGTQANNTPAVSPSIIATNRTGFMAGDFSGMHYSLTIFDTGAPAFFVQKTPTLPRCNVNQDFLCPATTLNLSASVTGYGTSSSTQVPFQIANATQLTQTNLAFSNIGIDNNGVLGGSTNAPLIFGITFFYGKSVYFGLDQRTSSLAPGPFVGF